MWFRDVLVTQREFLLREKQRIVKELKSISFTLLPLSPNGYIEKDLAPLLIYSEIQFLIISYENICHIFLYFLGEAHLIMFSSYPMLISSSLIAEATFGFSIAIKIES